MFVVIVLVFNFILVGHLSDQVDARLSERLAQSSRVLSQGGAQKTTSLEGSSGDQDTDDVPIFIWTLNSHGDSTAVTSRNPKLPNFPRTPGSQSGSVGKSLYRFDVTKFKTGYLIDGESLNNVMRIENSLYLTEVIVGLVLVGLMFAAAYVVGIRALAPVTLARDRQANFIADASHELRTPLSVLDAEVQVALSRGRDAASYRSALERIGQEGDRLQKIVEDLLWLARSDGHTAQSDELQRVDIAAVVKNSCERFEVLATSRGTTLTYNAPAQDLVFVNANEDLLDKLVGILLDNACKFAGTNGIIEVTLCEEFNHVTLRVDDSGPGVAKDVRGRIFERFHHSLSPLGGTGLGLAIADAIIQTTNAQCTVSSSEMGGARFDVVWPAM